MNFSKSKSSSFDWTIGATGFATAFLVSSFGKNLGMAIPAATEPKVIIDN